MTSALYEGVGFGPEEIRTGESTRAARLKWVVVVDSALPPGRAVNAAVCVASATGLAVAGLHGPAAVDGAGSAHPGLPWIGCSVLGATAGQLAELRAKAVLTLGVHVTDMPTDAQDTRVYDDYLARVAGTTELAYHALSLIGPRNRIDKLVRKLTLLP